MIRSSEELIIPQRFSRAVALHVIKNLLWDLDYRIPLILGIHGPSGEGKTFQCEAILNEMGVEQVVVSGRDFESEKAGEPARVLQDNYLYASDIVEQRRAKTAALIIHDIDACLGRWEGNVQYTVNNQLVTATLMSIADQPLRVGRRDARRIPIIVTGNDLTKLYGPLVREGRMVSFSWSPTVDEKIKIVRSLFAREWLSDEDLGRLVTRFAEMPVSFFSLLKTSMFDRAFVDIIEAVGLARVVDHVLRLPKNTLSRPGLSALDLERVAMSLIENDLVNHLQVGLRDNDRHRDE